MSRLVLHRRNERGYAQSDWLTSFHSFSFARYVDRERINFGALRVINGEADINEVFLAEKDALGIIGASVLTIETKAVNTKVLLIEIPMQLANL